MVLCLHMSTQEYTCFRQRTTAAPEKGSRKIAASSAKMMAPWDQWLTPARMLKMVWLNM
jgi:hypothetical protein